MNYTNTRQTFFLVLLISAFHGCTNSNSDKIVGVKIYEHTGPFEELFKQWEDHGINTALSSESLLSNPEYRSLAIDHKISTFVIFPVFFNADLLAESPEMYAIDQHGVPAREEWVEFVCPSREDYRKQVVDHAKDLVRNFDPDGISIDFIRHFVYWEKVYPDRSPGSLPLTCFDSSCMARFQAETGLRYPDSDSNPSAVSDWILNQHQDQWVDWKCRLITTMVEEIASAARKIKPDIQINVHMVPWLSKDFENAIRRVAGQDARDLSKIADNLSPMTYAHMVKREPAWIHTIVDDLYQQTGSQVIPSIQVNKAYLDFDMSNQEFRESINEALRPPSRGVIFWSWERLVKDPEKLKMLKDIP